MLSRLWETAFGNIVMKVWIYASCPVINDINRGNSVGSIPSHKMPKRNNQCTGRTSRQLWVKAPTLSTGSSLSPSLVASVWCWSSSRLAAASPAVSSARARLVRRRSASQLAAVTSRWTWIAKREAVRLPSRLQLIDRLGRPGLRNAKLFRFPPGCSFLGREHDLRKILIRHHTTKNFWAWNSNSYWLLASLIEMIRRWDGAACMIVTHKESWL